MSLVPPATRDGWSYSGDFLVEASGNNRHRRATVPELKAVYDGSDGAKDRPGHWYEAQLIHYGLPPSKTKGTAKMRLFDAVSKGNLAVPAHIKKTETELKKEWTKREREAKQALKKPAAPASTSARGSKRKADDGQVGMAPGTNVNINISMSMGHNGGIQMAPAGPAPKKAKPTPAAKKPTIKKPTTKKPTTKKSTTEPSTKAAPRTKQTARRGTSSTKAAKAVSSRPAPAAPAAPSDKPALRQTARRSRPFDRTSQARPKTTTTPQAPQFDATPWQWEDSPHDSPPPYSGSPMHHTASCSYHDDPHDYDDDPHDYDNGRYYDDDDDDGYGCY
jgi:hypothetical protein